MAAADPATGVAGPSLVEALRARKTAVQSISAASNGGRDSQGAVDAYVSRRRAIRRRHSAVNQGQGGRVVARHIGRDTVIAFSEQPTIESYNIELASDKQIKEHLTKPHNWVPQRHKTLPQILHDTAFLCSPADVPGLKKVQLQDLEVTPDVKQKFEELCKRYGDTFSKNNEDIGRTKLVKMDIDTGDSPPVSSRPYMLPLKHYEWVQREIESLEWAGVITKSMPKWASPIVVVPKKSAPGEPLKRRLCIDFRKVNELQQEVITAGKTKG